MNPNDPNLQKAVANTNSSSTSATVTTSTSFELAIGILSWHLHTPGPHQSSLLNRKELVSESVSELVTRVASDRTLVR